MGGAQPLAATMAGAAMLCVEVDPTRIERRLASRYLDEASESLDDAVARVRSAAAEGRPLSVGLLGNAAEVVPELARRGEALRPRHRPDRGPRPAERLRPGRVLGRGGRDAASGRPGRVPATGVRVDRATCATECSSSSGPGATFSITATTFEGRRSRPAIKDAFTYPGFVPAYIRPLFCRGIGPFRWAVLSGDPDDIAAIDGALRRALPGRPSSAALARARGRPRRVPGPAGADLLARLRRPRQGGPRDQRARPRRAGRPRRWSSGATISTRARSLRRTARRRRCRTGPTRSPTGRSSTRS